MSLSEKVVNEILDKGLAKSTWHDLFPRAYKDLLSYREDLQGSVEKGLRRGNLLKNDGIKVKIMIVVPNYWAKGETIDEAWKAVRGIAGGNLRDLKRGKHMIYVCFDKEDVQTRLDEFGMNISYPQGYPPVVIHKKDVD